MKTQSDEDMTRILKNLYSNKWYPVTSGGTPELKMPRSSSVAYERGRSMDQRSGNCSS